MIVKKSGPVVIGAQMTKDERKALEIECRRMMSEFDDKHADELEAIILKCMHRTLGLGPKRLKQFYDDYRKEVGFLNERYEDLESVIFVSKRDLQSIGVDIEAWHKEAKEQTIKEWKERNNK